MHTFNYTKNHRLLKREEFQHVMDHGQKVATRSMIGFRLCKELGVSSARLGIIASKKAGNSVVRNRIKRRLRAVFRTHFKDHAFDLVLIARNHAFKEDFKKLIQQFELVCKK